MKLMHFNQVLILIKFRLPQQKHIFIGREINEYLKNDYIIMTTLNLIQFRAGSTGATGSAGATGKNITKNI